MVREEMGDPENTGVQVYIGDEVPVRTMKDCSVVTATYELGRWNAWNYWNHRSQANGLRECSGQLKEIKSPA